MRQINSFIGRFSTIILLVSVTLLFSILSDSFLSFSNLTNILIQSSSLIILATGMTLVLITAGIDLSVGSIMFLIGVISGKLMVFGTSLSWVLPLCFFLGISIGVINGWIVTRLKIVPFIVTLATFYIGRGLGLFISDTRAINLPDSYLQLGTAKVIGIPLPVVIMLMVLISVQVFLSKTPAGRCLYAIGNSADKAKTAGISVNKFLLLAYTLSGICAAIAGVVSLSQLGAVSPTFGYQNEFLAISAAVLGGTSLFGGKGSVFPGTFVGALLIQIVQNGLVIINANPYMYPMITGSILFFVVLVDSQKNFSGRTTSLK